MTNSLRVLEPEQSIEANLATNRSALSGPVIKFTSTDRALEPMEAQLPFHCRNTSSPTFHFVPTVGFEIRSMSESACANDDIKAATVNKVVVRDDFVKIIFFCSVL